MGSTRPWAAYTLGVLLTIWPGLFFPRHAVKEHFATELEGKVCFSAFLALFVLPELMAGKGGISGVPCVPAEILALISQTYKPSVDSSHTGSRGGGCLGAFHCSCVLAWPSGAEMCPYPALQLGWSRVCWI